jgi:hypothetical protein
VIREGIIKEKVAKEIIDGNANDGLDTMILLQKREGLTHDTV